MKFLQEIIISEKIKNNPHYNVLMYEDENKYIVFNLNDKKNNRIATIVKKGDAIIVISSGSYNEKMRKAFAGMPSSYIITINGIAI